MGEGGTHQTQYTEIHKLCHTRILLLHTLFCVLVVVVDGAEALTHTHAARSHSISLWRKTRNTTNSNPNVYKTRRDDEQTGRRFVWWIMRLFCVWCGKLIFKNSEIILCEKLLATRPRNTLNKTSFDLLELGSSCSLLRWCTLCTLYLRWIEWTSLNSSVYMECTQLNWV